MNGHDQDDLAPTEGLPTRAARMATSAGITPQAKPRSLASRITASIAGEATDCA